MLFKQGLQKILSKGQCALLVVVQLMRYMVLHQPCPFHSRYTKGWQTRMKQKMGTSFSGQSLALRFVCLTCDFAKLFAKLFEQIAKTRMNKQITRLLSRRSVDGTNRLTGIHPIVSKNDAPMGICRQLQEGSSTPRKGELLAFLNFDYSFITFHRSEPKSVKLSINFCNFYAIATRGMAS